ncbi:MAG: hypothetical protein JXJ22_15025 [Bacteroidales bacterium]|nr:hypothetical protein [Bacteroidales bacterium]
MIKKENITSGVFNNILYVAFIIFLSLPLTVYVQSFLVTPFPYRTELVYSPFEKYSKKQCHFIKIYHQGISGVTKSRSIYNYFLFHFNKLVFHKISFLDTVYLSIEKSVLSLFYPFYFNKDEVDLMY